MIELMINEQLVDLGIDTSIRFSYQNSLFSDDGLPMPHSFPFTLPVTKNNRQILQFADRLDSIQRTTKFPAKLFVNHQLFFTGIAEITSSRIKSVIRVSLYTDVTILNDLLTSLDLGGDRTITDESGRHPEIQPHLVNALAYPDIPYCFPYLYNVQFGPVNQHSNTSSPVNDFYCPFVYVQYIIDQICQKLSKTLTGSFFSDPEIQSLCIYNNRYLQYIWVPPPTNTHFFEDFDLINHVPRISIGSFLNALTKFFGLLIFPDQNTINITSHQAILSSGEFVDYTAQLLKIYNHDFDPKTGYNIAHTYDQNDTFSDTFKIIEGGNYLGVYPSYSLIILIPSPTTYDYAFSTLENTFYTWNGSNWIELAYWYEPMSSTLKEIDFTSEASTTRMDKRDLIHVDQPYNLALNFPQEFQDFSLRFLFARGFHSDRDSLIKFLASSERYNYSGSSVGSLCLRTNDIDGPYHKFFENLIPYIAKGKYTKADLNFSFNDLINFKPDKTIVLDNQKYLWITFDFILSQQGIEQTQALLLNIT